MYPENGRDIIREIMILVCVAIEYRANLAIGLGLLALMGALILQSAFTNWCPADLFLRPLGMKKK